jgi:DNA polymerase-3 subunit chi
MGAAYFYHLTRHPLQETLPVLLQKARGAGWRIAVRGTMADRMSWLDDSLWQGSADSFLAHGLAGGPHDALQPILLTTTAESANAPECLMTVDGAVVTPEEVQALERVCILFDGTDPDAVQQARGQWKRAVLPSTGPRNLGVGKRKQRPEGAGGSSSASLICDLQPDERSELWVSFDAADNSPVGGEPPSICNGVRL